MTYEYPEGSTPSTSGGTSTAQSVRDEASTIAQNAAQSTQHLADEAKAQVKDVAAEAGRQGKDLLDQGRSQLTAQASEQKTRAAGGIRSFGSQLGQMADAAEGGIAADVARTVAQRSTSLASWLDAREPADILDEVKEFARRRPGTFLAVAAAAGLLAGRLTRGVKDASGQGAATGYGTAGSHRAPGAATTPATLAGSAPSSGGAYGAPTTGVYGTGAYGAGTATTATGTYGTGGTYGSGSGSDTYGAASDVGAATSTGTAPVTPLDEGYGTATGDPGYGVEAEENR